MGGQGDGKASVAGASAASLASDLANFVLVRAKCAPEGGLALESIQKALNKPKHVRLKNFLKKEHKSLRAYVDKVDFVRLNDSGQQLLLCLANSTSSPRRTKSSSTSTTHSDAAASQSEQKKKFLKVVQETVKNSENQRITLPVLGQRVSTIKKKFENVGSLKPLISKMGAQYGLSVSGEVISFNGDAVVVGNGRGKTANGQAEANSSNKKKRVCEVDHVVNIVRNRNRELHALKRLLIQAGFEIHVDTVERLVKSSGGRLHLQISSNNKKIVAIGTEKKIVKFTNVPTSSASSVGGGAEEEERRVELLAIASSVGRVSHWLWDPQKPTHVEVAYDESSLNATVEEVFKKPIPLFMSRTRLRYEIVPKTAKFDSECLAVDASLYDPPDSVLLAPFVDEHGKCLITIDQLTPPVSLAASSSSDARPPRASAVVLVVNYPRDWTDEPYVLKVFSSFSASSSSRPFGVTLRRNLVYVFFKEWAPANASVKSVSEMRFNNEMKIGFAKAPADARPEYVDSQPPSFARAVSAPPPPPQPVYDAAPSAAFESFGVFEPPSSENTNTFVVGSYNGYVDDFRLLPEANTNTTSALELPLERLASDEQDAFLLEQEQLLRERKHAQELDDEQEMASRLPSDLWTSTLEDDDFRFDAAHAVSTIVDSPPKPQPTQRKQPSWAAKAANEAGPKMMALKPTGGSFGLSVAAVDVELTRSQIAPQASGPARGWGQPLPRPSHRPPAQQQQQQQPQPARRGIIPNPARNEFPSLGSAQQQAPPPRQQRPPQQRLMPRGQFVMPTRRAPTFHTRDALRPTHEHPNELSTANVNVVIVQTGDELPMVLDAYTRGGDVKQMLLLRSNVRAALPPEAGPRPTERGWLRLIHRGRELRDDDLLLRCGVERDDVLHVSIRE